MAELEEISVGLPTRHSQRELRAEARAKVIERLARSQLQFASAVYIAQRAHCFHCGGPLPIFARHIQPGSSSKEHALPSAGRTGDNRTDGAFVLAHTACNGERGERLFTTIEWQRAAEVWSRADAIWKAGGRKGSLFPFWIELADRMQSETTP